VARKEGVELAGAEGLGGGAEGGGEGPDVLKVGVARISGGDKAERATLALRELRAVKGRFGEYLLHAQDAAVGGPQFAFACTKLGLERGLKFGIGERVHGEHGGLHELAGVDGVGVGLKLAVGVTHGAPKARLVEVYVLARPRPDERRAADVALDG
jgi:hypothetical protein